LIPQLKDRALVGEFKLNLGRLASRQVKHKEAYDAYLEAITIYETIGDKRARAEVLLLLAAEEDALGQFAASRRSLEKAVRLFSEEEALDGKVRGLHRLAAYAERERKYGKARKLLEEVYEIYKELDQPSQAANVKRHLNALPAPEPSK
jgi:tetratricopeptide (TPR) repeat protein